MTGGIERGFDSQLFLQEMLALSDQSAASRPPPQLIVWPEAMAAVPPLNREWLQAPNGDAALLVSVAGIRARVTRLDNARGHSTPRWDRGHRPAAG